MKKLINLFSTLLTLTLSACASIEPIVDRNATLDGMSGYIGSSFTRTDSGGFALK